MALTLRARRWLDRWGPLLPVLVAELVILLGFGALLPVLPLFVVEHGIDVPTLGLILAAWSIAKLVAEPIFGYIADRTSRRPFLIGGAIVLAIATVLPLVFSSALALFLLRAVSGAAAGAYDPAARGMIVDATEEGERGEAFGIYASFQMGGFILGPVIGAFGAAIGGGYAFPFVMCGVLTALAAVLLAVALPDAPHVREPAPIDLEPTTPSAAIPRASTAPAPPAATAPLRDLLNRSLLAALVIHLGFSLAFGVYEVIWSLYLTDLGASVGWIGVTFMLFALPMMIVSPIAGRLVDRHGSMGFVVVSSLVILASGVLYTLATEPLFPSAVVPAEAVAEAFLMPALYAMVALGTPAGRSSTAQGIFGAVGTIGLIVASVAAGILWEVDHDLPFLFFVVGSGLCLLLGLVVHRWAPISRTAAPSLAAEPA